MDQFSAVLSRIRVLDPLRVQEKVFSRIRKLVAAGQRVAPTSKDRLSADCQAVVDGSASFRVAALPWLGNRPGYEDWCLLDGSWALDPLNAFAVAGPVMSAHVATAGTSEDERDQAKR